MNTKLCVVCLLLGVSVICSPLNTTADTLHGPFPSAAQKVTLVQAKKQAAQVERGTSRAAIEKLYRYQDGGLSSYELSRYYLGNNIMVDVPFDRQGGEGREQNRVSGPLRVYLSPPHQN